MKSSFILFFSLLSLFACSSQKKETPGLIVLNMREFGPQTCKEKPSPQFIKDIEENYGSLSLETEQKIFSILSCDNSKLFRFNKLTRYLSSIAEKTTILSRDEFLSYYIPRVCIQRIDYEENPGNLSEFFQKNYKSEAKNSMLSCENKKYREILRLISEEKRMVAAKEKTRL